MSCYDDDYVEENNDKIFLLYWKQIQHDPTIIFRFKKVYTYR